MQEFDSIRPYRDDEVPGVLQRLIQDPKLQHAAATLFMPKIATLLPGLADWLTRLLLAHHARSFRSVDELQKFLTSHFSRFVKETTTDIAVTGVDALDTDKTYLYISNHRDILMDNGLMNLALLDNGHETTESAVGDNLLAEPYAGDLMRLNKSFVIERSVTGKRAVYRSLTKSSHYIRRTLEAGNSVWIAQREGRSKDGWDRTEPAVLKMLALAYRKDFDTFTELVAQIRLVPVSISYELDPCDRLKAHELAVLDRDGSYEKAPDEDLMSIVSGLTGSKGRVHVHFSDPMEGDFDESGALALALDKAIVGGLEVFPTQAWAAKELGLSGIPDTVDWLPDGESDFVDRVNDCPEWERRFLLEGYGNLIKNRVELQIQPGSS